MGCDTVDLGRLMDNGLAFIEKNAMCTSKVAPQQGHSQGFELHSAGFIATGNMPLLSEQCVNCDTVDGLGVFMDNGFAFTRKNAAESVTVTEENSFGKGRVRGHMMWLTHHTRICQQGHTVDEVRRITTYGVLSWGLGLLGQTRKPLGRVRLLHLSSPSWDSARGMRRPLLCAPKKNALQTYDFAHLTTVHQLIN